MSNQVLIQKYQHLFDIFDFNDNKIISQEDVTALFARLKPVSPSAKSAYDTAERWWRLMSKFANQDKDNKLTLIEWEKWATTFVNELQLVDTRSEYFQHFENAMFEEIEVETEGYYKTISVEEYKKWAEVFQIKGDAAELFKKLDSEGAGADDGEIFQSEFRDLLLQFFTSEDKDAPGNYLWGDPFNKNA